MAHKSLSGSKSIKKTEFIAKIGSFDPDTDSIKMRIADAQEETKRWVGLSYANEAC